MTFFQQGKDDYLIYTDQLDFEKANQYMVEVEVKVNDPGPPNFDDMQKVGLKVSDVDFDDSKGDYIAFSKIGLEVPVIEKYHNDNQQKLKELHTILYKKVGKKKLTKVGEAVVYDLGGNIAEYYEDGIYGYSAYDFYDANDDRMINSKHVGIRVIKQ